MRRILVPVCVLLIVLLASTAFSAVKRVALVLGNGEYRNVCALPNPPNDAQAVADKLTEMGFEVQLELNLTKDETDAAMQRYLALLKNAKAAVFFYAGHGLQVNGINYIVPVDAVLDEETDLLFEVVKVDTVLSLMETEERVNLVFLDACRDNPLARSLARSMKSRSTSVQQGLAPIDAAVGTLISYATKENNVAADGEGDHSPYTRALLRHIDKPVDVAIMLRQVREDVIEDTNSQQVPWEYGSLIGEFYFLGPTEVTIVQPPAAESAQAPPSTPSADKEALFWDSIKDSEDPALFKEYLKQYPEGTFAGLAQIKSQPKVVSQPAPQAPVAVLTPPPPPLPPQTQDMGKYVLHRHPRGQDTVTDKNTGLMWMQRDDGVERRWAEACGYCEQLDWGGHTDWRAPDLKELKSLQDKKHRYPDIDPVFDAESLWYWSRSSGPGDPNYAWVINFNGAVPYSHEKKQEYYVRCVREAP